MIAYAAESKSSRLTPLCCFRDIIGTGSPGRKDADEQSAATSASMSEWGAVTKKGARVTRVFLSVVPVYEEYMLVQTSTTGRRGFLARGRARTPAIGVELSR